MMTRYSVLFSDVLMELKTVLDHDIHSEEWRCPHNAKTFGAGSCSPVHTHHIFSVGTRIRRTMLRNISCSKKIRHDQ